MRFVTRAALILLVSAQCVGTALADDRKIGAFTLVETTDPLDKTVTSGAIVPSLSDRDSYLAMSCATDGLSIGIAFNEIIAPHRSTPDGRRFPLLARAGSAAIKTLDVFIAPDGTSLTIAGDTRADRRRARALLDSLAAANELVIRIDTPRGRFERVFDLIGADEAIPILSAHCPHDK